MKHLISKLIPIPILSKIKERRAKDYYKKWIGAGSPIPPHHSVKKITVKSYQQNFNYDILIETGTFEGEMIIGQFHNFKEIHSIELSDHYYQKAVKRFRRYPKIHLHNGDSSKLLGDIIKTINEPVIFWLDGHYSGGLTAKGNSECPIWGELDAILQTNFPHILLIDDARCFDGKGDYPTIEAVKEHISAKANIKYFKIKDDIIQVALNN